VYATDMLGSVHRVWKEYEQAVEWYTKAAEAGLPRASSSSGSVSTRGRAWRRRTTQRRRAGTGARQTPTKEARQLTFQSCKLLAAVGPGR
jgi:TPR repeat protein